MKELRQEEIDHKIAKIKKVFIDVPIIDGPDGYPYSLFSLTDFYPPMTPDVVEDMADIMVHYGNFDDATIIVSEADRGGGPLTHAIATRTGLPYSIANWYPAEIPGQVKVMTSVGFSGSGAIYLNGMEKGMKAVIVDDLLSTGGTVIALLEAVEKAGAETIEAVFVAEKIGKDGRARVARQFDTPLKTFVRFRAEGDRTTEYVEADDPFPFIA